jgi:AraC family transcriptional regulator
MPVDLDLRSSKSGEPIRRHKSWLGLSAEYVRIVGPTTYDFQVKRSSSYVALHEFKRMAGETFIDGTRRSELKDLRNKITVVPDDCGVNGWTRIADDAYFTAVYFYRPTDEGALGGSAQQLSQIAPMLLFENELVRASLLKFQAILNGAAPGENIYAETLGLLLSLELSRVGHRMPTQPSPARGGLTRRQVRQVVDYMEANLQNDVSLSDLAGLLNLSRFHFVRTFKQSTGLPPHRFLMARRIERAKDLLAQPGLSISEVSRRAGFHGVTQFTRSFRRLTGTTPSGFRRDRF